MKFDRLEKVKLEISRLGEAVKRLEAEQKPRGMNPLYYYGGRYTAAVKRASLDVTMALADLRRSDFR